MFTIIRNLPDYVLGVEAHGHITDADYRDVLIPEAEKRFAKHPALRMFYVAGEDFEGYDTHAMWDDTLFDIEHWTSFSAIALVTDMPWLRAMVHVFSPFFPGAVKVFDLSRRAEAEKWIIDGAPAPKK